MSFNEARKIYADLKRFESKIPEIVSEMGAIGLNHSLKSFRNQGFEDTYVERWPARKREDRRRPGRAILVNTGRLRRSLRRMHKGRFSVDLISNTPYAKIHNDGGEGMAFGKYRFKMPKRQFMGYSHVMNRKIEIMINRKVIQTFKQ